MIIWAIKILLLVVSLSGYIYLWAYKDKKIKFEYIPILVISLISNLLLTVAYVGLLKPVAILIYAGGFIALFYSVSKKRDIIKINPTYIIFIMGVIAISVLVYGKLFNEHDSYSHYGIMVKRMLLHDNLPDATDNVIIFKSYPAAMSCFLYMSCLINGGEDWSMTATQGIVLIACVYTLVASVKNNRVISYMYIAFVGFGMIYYCNFITSLMLDTIIPLLGGVAFLIYYEYKQNIKEYLLYITLILSFCVLVKNSGFAFLAVFAIMAFIFTKKDKIKTMIFSMVIPSAMYFLWTIHVRVAFPGGMESNHAMSVEHYADVYSQRSASMIRDIMLAFYDRLFNRENPGFYVLNMFAIVMFFIYITRQQKIKEKLHVVLTVYVAYIIWLAGTLGMYIFSMEDTKASMLDCFERYRATGEMFCFYIISYIILGLINTLQMGKIIQSIKGIRITLLPDSEKHKNIDVSLVFSSISLALSISTMIPLWTNRHIGWRTEISTDMREEITSLVSHYELDADLTYLIYGEDEFDYMEIQGNMLSPYRPFLTVQYALNSRQIVFANEGSFEEALNKNRYDVLIFLKNDDVSKSYKENKGYGTSDVIICEE